MFYYYIPKCRASGRAKHVEKEPDSDHFLTSKGDIVVALGKSEDTITTTSALNWSC